MLSFILAVISIVSLWMIFRKMGYGGWESIIPFYNTYVIMDWLYGQGWKMLLFLIPFYNLYLMFKVNIDLAHAFGKSTGFGVGLVLLNFVFYPILAFGDAQPAYQEGQITDGSDGYDEWPEGQQWADTAAVDHHEPPQYQPTEPAHYQPPQQPEDSPFHQPQWRDGE